MAHPIDRGDEERKSMEGSEEDDVTTMTTGSGPWSAGSSESWSAETDHDLPDTVTILDAPEGGKVYLVGTAHFSLESNRDVEKTIRKIQPNVVVLELCKSRLAILSLDEKTLLEESSNLSLEKIRENIHDQGFVQGVMYTLLLSLSAHLTRELGMAPGGEFRTAYKEAKNIPGCKINLGDRAVHLTLRRAIGSLTWWQKVKLGCSIIFSKETVTKEEVEKCKDRDLLQKMLEDITGEYPTLSHVLVNERDTYLTYSLQLAAQAVRDVRRPDHPVPAKVVGVVGIGHVPGILRNWGTVTDSDIAPLVSLPEQSWTSFLILKGVKYSFRGLLVIAAYRYVLPSSVKTACESSIQHAWQNVLSALKPKQL